MHSHNEQLAMMIASSWLKVATRAGSAAMLTAAMRWSWSCKPVHGCGRSTAEVPLCYQPVVVARRLRSWE
jgi:hypothetical protein